MSTIRTLAAAVIVSAAATVATSAAPLIAGGYYQEQITGGCNGLGACEVMFTPVPAGKTLIIRSVACASTFTNVDAFVTATSLSGREPGNALIQRNVYPRAELISKLPGAKRYQIQSDVLHVLTAGQKPRVYIGLNAASPTFNAICTISGELK